MPRPPLKPLPAQETPRKVQLTRITVMVVATGSSKSDCFYRRPWKSGWRGRSRTALSEGVVLSDRKKTTELNRHTGHGWMSECGELNPFRITPTFLRSYPHFWDNHHS